MLFYRLALPLLLAMSMNNASAADKTYDVHFFKGTTGISYQDVVIKRDANAYRLRGRAEQRLKVRLSLRDQEATYFNITTLDGVSLYDGSSEGNSASLLLPYDGDFIIHVFNMGDNIDKRVPYQLSISLK
ncbi:hypothetical protein ACK330_11725 [Aeromonas taiwanensis]|uniref:hypothetical protein n=1 Tax=Aeromonas taiwanensis TaxID=633417 RepID=UPI00248E00D2|nr:hypothetical protein [Aeromonas taiwanensis]